MSKSKCTKHTSFGAFFEGKMSKKCTPLWREAHLEVKTCKIHHVRTCSGPLLKVQMSPAKSEPNVSHLKKIWKDAFRGRCSTNDMFIRDVRRSGG